MLQYTYNMKYTTRNREETLAVAQKYIESLLPKEDSVEATVIGLYGELGAGKTTFTQGLAQALGVGGIIVSPTFVIEKIYDLPDKNKMGGKNKFKRLIHIDAYRLEHSDELLHLGFRDIISDSENLILIEWPERVSSIMPEHICIKFAHISENEREIDISE